MILHNEISLVLGYWVWSIKRKKGIALKDKFTHCTIQRFAGWQCAAKLFQQKDQNFPRDPQMTSNWGICWAQHFFMPDMAVFQSLLCFLSLSDFILFRCSWKNFGVFSVPLFLWFLSFCVVYSLQIFLRKFWLVFHPSLSLCFLSFCASVPCRCSCESFSVLSVPRFLCVS